MPQVTVVTPDEHSSTSPTPSRWKRFKRIFFKNRIVPISQVTDAEGQQNLFSRSPTKEPPANVKADHGCGRAIPRMTLDNWRWGLQECLVLGLILWVPYVDRVNNAPFLGGNGRWCVPAAVAVIEGTAGGSTRRMIDRLMGTIAGSLWVVVAFLIFGGVTAPATERHVALRICIWIFVCSGGWVWGWLRWRFPTRPLFAISAAFTTPLIYAGSVTYLTPLNTAFQRSLCCLFGIIVSALVVRYFLPKRARVDILHNFCTILDEIADALEPLIELESGLVSSPTFLCNGDEVFTEASQRSHRDLGEFQKKPENVAANWQHFRDKMWNRLEQCGKLTLGQSTLMVAARGEMDTRRSPKLMHSLENALFSIRTLFYHATSLFNLIDTQVAAASADFDQAGLMEEAQLFSRFGILTLQASESSAGPVPSVVDLGAKAVSAPNILAVASKPKLCEKVRHIPLSVADLGTLDILSSWAEPGADSTTSHHPIHSRTQLDAAEMYRCEIAPLMKWAEIYGPTVGGMARHLCEALRQVASDMRDHSQSNKANKAIHQAGKLIAHFHHQRSERQQAVAILVEYSVREALRQDEANEWFVNYKDPKFAERFERVLGISVDDYRQLSDEGRDAFWLTYWTLRDRLSTTDSNVMSLFVATRNTVDAMEVVNAETRTRKKDDKEMLVSVDEIRLQAQIAVGRAGGNPRNIG
eukprot:Blabericola_migrator_1__4276@NODE_230_length_11080_cov_61_366385_g196_i0_p2_GENE_NODE_230_length_11080_cov_61_366385_g196_i0NODE_230_length_11080_cov_61_366385_g196_i0_p2_ORF_typecomplete_len697_score91_97ALMT/PF11744_8/1_3e15ALMT/PF11744_8/6_2e02FUSC/PF04632_12/8_4e16FUSC/PF04632_12/2_1e02FUSC_2/PF13515_6/1_8e10ArAE_2_N/PF10337_9/2e05ArAE_1/PF06081_11/0_0007NiFe_hyd_3_EhaA/PF17367_2/0_018SH3_14/PF18343_1/0_042Guanylate_kin/PF00625_21/0_34_NODE_230_length_11080_cov_61_366385_g196_i07342824